MEKRRIAIVGKMGSGKTTLGEVLAQMGFVKIAFADPVKDVSAVMLNAFLMKVYPQLDPANNVPHLFDRDIINAEKGNPIVRKFLQFVGTELGREYFGPQDVWINKFLEATEEAEAQGVAGVVNDDCRFVNEAERLKAEGFFVVKLIRNETERQAYLRGRIAEQNPHFTDEEVLDALHDILNHASETEIDSIQAHVDIPSLESNMIEGSPQWLSQVVGQELATESREHVVTRYTQMWTYWQELGQPFP